MTEIMTSDSAVPLIMGILNVTPDSFYDGGEFNQRERALERTRQLVKNGADIVDIGGESTRPGASEVPEDTEIERVVPIVRALKEDGIDVPVSVDTRKSAVARKAIQAGADWINDVTGLRGDSEMADTIAGSDVRVVIMHMQGNPRTMQDDPTYDDVVDDVYQFFEKRMDRALQQGISEEQLVIDPGIGFGKTLEHNRRLLKNIHRFQSLGPPVLVGHSRKSFLKSILDVPPEERLTGTLSVSAHLIAESVDVLRVHDVAEHVELRTTLNWIEGRFHDG